MPDQGYAVFSVPATPEAEKARLESRGGRIKRWISLEGEKNPWLLKFPRPLTGEHWAEKVAAEVGSLIGTDCARVELARCDGELATICESFIPDGFDTLGSTDLQIYFLHGCDVLQMVFEGYDIRRELRFRQREHNIKNIIATVEEISKVPTVTRKQDRREVLRSFVSYALLDALIGNTDRHHENWMLKYEQGIDRISAAPSFDHASSLGRELKDAQRRHILDSDGMLRYLHRGRGGVYVDKRRKRALAPLRLARLLCRWQPDFTRSALDKIRYVPDHQFRAIIDKVPSEFMSDAAKDFAYQVVITSKSELVRSIR